ncbi:MAG: DUF305 domain-containing protein [Chloroflexaceae bacterium]|nr:DUF305 domain-containing protein [Chloroflexaceae bacterium]
MKHHPVCTALLLLLLLTGCGLMDRNIGPPTSASPPTLPTVVPGTVSLADQFGQLVDERDDLPYDALLLDTLSVHMLGAVDLANQAIRRTSDPVLLELAEEIVAIQQRNVARLQQWRRTWYPDLGVTPAIDLSIDTGGLVAVDNDAFDAAFEVTMLAYLEQGRLIAEDGRQQATRPELRDMAAELLTDYEQQIAQLQRR